MVLALVALVAFTAPASPAAAAQPSLAPPDGGGNVNVQIVEPGDSIGIRILDIPKKRVEDPRALAYIIDSLKPGATIRRRLEVANYSRNPQHVNVYAGAATIDNNVFTAAEGHLGNDLSSWVSVDAPNLDMQGQSRKEVWVTITVPTTASKGERYGAVWAEMTKPATENDRIARVNRVGIRIYLDIGPGGEPPTDFEIGRITVTREVEQWPLVTVEVRNTGGRAIDLAGTLSLSNGDGAIKAGPFKINGSVTLLPGASGQVTALLNKTLPPGDWDLDVNLVTGTLERKASATLNVPGPVAAKPIKPWWQTPRAIAGAAVVALLAATGFVFFRRRRALTTRRAASSAADQAGN